jgi:hypothetical protein
MKRVGEYKAAQRLDGLGARASLLCAGETGISGPMLVHSPICRRLPRSICIARSVVSYTNREGRGRARARLQWTTRIEALHFRQPGRFLPQVRCRGSGVARPNKQRRAAIPSGWQEKSVERSVHGLRRTGGPLLEDRLQYRSAWGSNRSAAKEHAPQKSDSASPSSIPARHDSRGGCERALDSKRGAWQ